MATENDRGTKPQDMVAWVGFAENSAILRRVLVPGGAKGLLLRTGPGEAGETVREKALGFGFTELKTRGTLRMLFPDGNIPFSARVLSEGLGGSMIALKRDDLLSDKWTINLSDRAPAAVAAAKPQRIQPDPESIRTIGLNLRGEEVVRDNSGRFFRKVNHDDGRADFVHEQEGEKPTLFLRAGRREDLEAIASSLVVMAGRGTLHTADFERVADAALEEGPHGRLDIDRETAMGLIREHMLREISAIAVENDASRDKFIAAMRVASATGFVLSRRSGDGEALSPSPAMVAFMRRATRGQNAVDFRGSDDMKIAMPRIFREGAALQVHDLGGIAADGIGAYAANVLARRAADGRTILRVPGSVTADTFERLRSDIGRNYALEAVAEIGSAVADGVQDGDPSLFVFIGERRPEPLDALPQAALRTFKVVTTDDLMNLEREIARSRSRIRDFHDGVEEAGPEAEDGREENIRQKPYQPLSQVKEPFTMIPVALEGATTKALDRVRRDMDDRGGVDAVVASALGQSLDGLGDILTAEQVDTVAMRLNARDRGRGFLLGDQTGVGKGRSLAAMTREHIRADAGNRVLYFTESAQINIPDVCRDLKDVGAWPEIRVLFLTSGSHMTDVTIDPVTGLEISREIVSPPASVRKAIFNGEAWPEDYNVVITTYSQFRSKEDDPSSIWLANALDARTLLVLDEAHNALNPNSQQGRNIRAAIAQVGPENVIYGTATPSRDPSGMNLYKPLLPQAGDGRLDELLDNMASGGEVAQEAFATMLAEDGVLLRRDHDLSNIEFRVSLPDDERMLRYQEIMNRFSPAVELMIECSSQIGEHLGRRQTAQYNALIARGLSAQAARARTNEMNQYSIALGSPLANLARITMNAIKIDQVVDVALQEIQEGRKPLITFHSTNVGLLQEMSRGADGKVSEEAMRNAQGLTLKDQIRRIHEGMYRIKVDGETRDAREVYPDVARTFEMIDRQIGEIPDNLPVSPVDALVERLEQNGVTVGEISGRTLCYRDNQIQRRQGRNRRDTIDAFNAGGLDVLIYNSAGATGGSYHASPKFADQRPRTMIELEAPIDVIKYVQSQGRGNRYGQVANPRVVSVMTGLTPEMRILQQRNRKLRSLGASVDGNRAHPLLLDDVPDLLNRVGDEATRNVLLAMPSLARRLGFPEFAEDPSNQNQGQGNDAVDTGSGTATSGIDSLSNKVLARSIVLTALEQDDLVSRIRMEFDAIIEELESRNANPLRPKQLDGQVEIRATTLYSGMESEENDLDTSAFLSPLYISTGIHHFNEEAWNGDKLVTAVEACRRLYGADGFAPWAERIHQNLPLLMRPYLPEGISMEAALENPQAMGSRFKVRHERFTDLAWLLENMKPGVSIRYPSEFDPNALITRTIVGLVPPTNPAFYDIPSAYKIKTISPGMANPETTSISRISSMDHERIFFRPGLSESFEESYLEEFDREGLLTRRLPVQVLSGNILQAINEATRHDLGTVSLYRDMENHVHRGIVVARAKVDLEKLPVPVSGGRIAAEIAYRHMEAPETSDEPRMMKIWGGVMNDRVPGERLYADMVISITQRTFKLDMMPLRKSTRHFFAARPGLYDLMYGRPLPSFEDTPDRAYRRQGAKSVHLVEFRLDGRQGKERAIAILERLGESMMLTDGKYRGLVNQAVIDLDAASGHPVRQFSGEEPEEAEPEVIADPENAETEAPGADAPVLTADPAEAEADAEPDYENIEWR
ncbi:strawberry notch C-terminal domain-containing protein [Defluviimonas salinarum]|uniref:Strawberry notch C-terminal domain-containing protein n=1 Tax=Defluviimonas salinarum TaxID=2992147 RepID=A0ABT3J5K1_9RHOB|nr:strawberry notch C-terminal domain-containing protein [Defluviimonas salinarum]MCW3782977.1 strawberry notch C-terminal domain-containing protein [Defluviimonas salinarum]